jgi:hypothetical protein
MKEITHPPRMAPLKSEPPGMERDNRGNAIPLAQRTADDQAKAKRGKTAKGVVSAGHLPQRSDAVSGDAGRTPETPPKPEPPPEPETPPKKA